MLLPIRVFKEIGAIVLVEISEIVRVRFVTV